MPGIDVSYDSSGDALIVWFDHPAKERRSEPSGEDMILKKDANGRVIGIEKKNYFNGPEHSLRAPD